VSASGPWRRVPPAVRPAGHGPPPFVSVPPLLRVGFSPRRPPPPLPSKETDPPHSVPSVCLAIGGAGYSRALASSGPCRLAISNDQQWAGDYRAGAIDAISMWVNNLSSADLDFRLAFEAFGPMGQGGPQPSHSRFAMQPIAPFSPRVGSVHYPPLRGLRALDRSGRRCRVVVLVERDGKRAGGQEIANSAGRKS